MDQTFLTINFTIISNTYNTDDKKLLITHVDNGISLELSTKK